MARLVGLGEAEGEGGTPRATKPLGSDHSPYPFHFLLPQPISIAAALDLTIASPLLPPPFFSLPMSSFVNLDPKGHHFSQSLASSPQKTKSPV